MDSGGSNCQGISGRIQEGATVKGFLADHFPQADKMELEEKAQLTKPGFFLGTAPDSYSARFPKIGICLAYLVCLLLDASKSIVIY